MNIMKVVTSLIFFFFSFAAALNDEKLEEEDKEDYSEHPKYVYEYGVNDPITKDIKKHWEERDGDLVKGSYRFVQPDGSLRIVDYSSDDKNGFNAFVKFEGLAEHPDESEIERESQEAPLHSESLKDSFDFNFLPEEHASISPPQAEKEEEEENLNASQKNSSIHSYRGKGREKGSEKGYEVQENPESNESIEEEID